MWGVALVLLTLRIMTGFFAEFGDEDEPETGFLVTNFGVKLRRIRIGAIVFELSLG